jgi:hypothetical protein
MIGEFIFIKHDTAKLINTWHKLPLGFGIAKPPTTSLTKHVLQILGILGGGGILKARYTDHNADRRAFFDLQDF